MAESLENTQLDRTKTIIIFRSHLPVDHLDRLAQPKQLHPKPYSCCSASFAVPYKPRLTCQ